LADLPAPERYEWITCSHVIVHVADPLQIVQLLNTHLTERGTRYIEIPMVIWVCAPLQEEPVTHLNFLPQHHCAT
jgi:2-polyprenyl-3-methyl-5-hydroxy-6-metoxy-1,4-benzoquinol methylase